MWCVKWSAQKGGWVRLPFTLSENRVESSCWAWNNTSMVIMGGWKGWNSETVSSDGVSTRSSFAMKYETR